MKPLQTLASALGVGALIFLSSPAAVSAPSIGEAEALSIGVDAYVYGYPIVTTEITRRIMTNTAASDGIHAPMGQFAHMRAYLTAQFNMDTLYSPAWLDLSKGPYVVSMPDMKDRYYLMPMLDAWTNVFEVPGKRTTGTGPQRYVITGPGWKGTLPAGVTEYKAPTNIIRIIGRIYSTGTPEDYAEVHRIQDQLSLVPLSGYGKPHPPVPGKVDPDVDMNTPVRDQVARMDAATFFATMADAMKKNPPAAVDAPMVDRMAKIGIVPGQDFDTKSLLANLIQVPMLGQRKILDHVKDAGTLVNGWVITTKTGEYGTDYLQRATIAAIGLGANRPKDAVFATSEKDADGHEYDATHNYVIHFDKGQIPPGRGFWSLTMYDDRYFVVPNSLNRHTLSQRNKLTVNRDGSVDLYLQKTDPGGSKTANWLPTPAGRFIPIMRIYWPNDVAPSILDGSWKPPPIKRASTN